MKIQTAMSGLVAVLAAATGAVAAIAFGRELPTLISWLAQLIK